MPKTNNTGAAVVVFPGGGYQILAIDLEGTEVCDWLVQKGITCVLLKYRVPSPHKSNYWGAYPESPIALEDAQRTIGLVRLHATDWHIDPHKVGKLGFSAGGHLVAAASVHTRRVYAPVDAADQFSCRPDFAIALLPRPASLLRQQTPTHRSQAQPRRPSLRTWTKNAPPTFILQNEDDDVDGVNESLVYYIALKNARRSRRRCISTRRAATPSACAPPRLPATHWPALVETFRLTYHRHDRPVKA